MMVSSQRRPHPCPWPGMARVEARQEIIEESSGSEADDTYVAEAQDNLYEELDISYSSVDEIYEEIL